MQAPKDAHAAPLREILSLELLSERRERHALCLIKNILAGNCHPALFDFFVTQPDDSMVVPVKSKLQLGKKRFRVTGVEVYNKYRI